MSQTHSIFKATRRQGYRTQWQQERARGPILGMEYPRKPLLARIREKWRKAR